MSDPSPVWSIVNDLIYAGIIGGFLLVVISFFLKKKPKEILSMIKDWFQSDSGGGD